MRFKAELKGVFRLALAFLEGIIMTKACYYKCYFCNQTLYAYQNQCDRCDGVVDRENDSNS